MIKEEFSEERVEKVVKMRKTRYICDMCNNDMKDTYWIALIGNTKGLLNTSHYCNKCISTAMDLLKKDFSSNVAKSGDWIRLTKSTVPSSEKCNRIVEEYTINDDGDKLGVE